MLAFSAAISALSWVNGPLNALTVSVGTVAGSSTGRIMLAPA